MRNIAGPAGLTRYGPVPRRVTRDPETRIRSGMDRTAVATVRSPHPGTPGGTVRGTPPWRTALPGYARSYEPPQRAGPGAIAQGAGVPASRRGLFQRVVCPWSGGSPTVDRTVCEAWRQKRSLHLWPELTGLNT